MSSSLRRLHELRRAGKSPVLPVFIGRDSCFLEQNVTEVGGLFIYASRHWPEWDLRCLAGIDVIVDLPVNDETSALGVAIRDSRPRRLQAFINGYLCGGGFCE